MGGAGVMMPRKELMSGATLPVLDGREDGHGQGCSAEIWQRW